MQRADSHRAFATWQRERAEQLEIVHGARARWHDETSDSREKADHARRELAEREPPVEEEWCHDEEPDTSGAPDEPELPDPERESEQAPEADADREEALAATTVPEAEDLDLHGAVERARAALIELQNREAARLDVNARGADEPEHEEGQAERDLADQR